tara:strand:- start:131 stop:526 length:396 start_codon:yes stop_codon:yes gene_type:complete
MGDRFYFQQQQTRGKRRMAWDEDKKAQAVEMYEDQNPTPETSMEIVSEIADELGESPNGVRMILTKAGVYVKKAQANGNGGASSGGTRISKQAAQDALIAAINDKGGEVDEDIISKLTGKAAQYFTGLLSD